MSTKLLFNIYENDDKIYANAYLTLNYVIMLFYPEFLTISSHALRSLTSAGPQLFGVSAIRILYKLRKNQIIIKRAQCHIIRDGLIEPF